jgi:hypothetical protein
VVLEYTINASPQTPVVLTNTGGDTYEGDFAGTVSVNDSVHYRIKAIDASINHNTAYHPSSGYHHFMIVDQVAIGIWEPDVTPITGAPLIAFCDSAGISYEYNTSYPTLTNYQCLFICLGVYSNNYQMTTQQANDLVSYLSGGGRCYLEGGDAWCYDPAGDIYRDDFGIAEVGDGSTMSGNILGETGTFTEGMTFGYAGENNWMDRIAPVSPAFTIFTNGGYNRSVAYDAGAYRSVGSSFELGGLIDGTWPSTKSELIHQILVFFGIIVGAQEEYSADMPAVVEFTVTPNPTRNNILFAIDLVRPTPVTIDMYNILGQHVIRVADGNLNAGSHAIEWNFRDTIGRKVSQGAYFYRIQTDTEVQTGKVLYIR